MPNSLPPELNNLIVVIFVCLFVLWTFRLCRNGLHLQDLRAGTSQNLVSVHASLSAAPECCSVRRRRCGLWMRQVCPRSRGTVLV